MKKGDDIKTNSTESSESLEEIFSENLSIRIEDAIQDHSVRNLKISRLSGFKLPKLEGQLHVNRTKPISRAQEKNADKQMDDNTEKTQTTLPRVSSSPVLHEGIQPNVNKAKKSRRGEISQPKPLKVIRRRGSESRTFEINRELPESLWFDQD